MRIKIFPQLGFLRTFSMLFWTPHRNCLSWKKKLFYNYFYFWLQNELLCLDYKGCWSKLSLSRQDGWVLMYMSLLLHPWVLVGSFSDTAHGSRPREVPKTNCLKSKLWRDNLRFLILEWSILGGFFTVTDTVKKQSVHSTFLSLWFFSSWRNYFELWRLFAETSDFDWMSLEKEK